MLEKFVGGFLGIILVIFIFAILAFASWLVCNLLTALIMFCFGIEYTYMIGTGIWLIVIFLGLIIRWLKG